MTFDDALKLYLQTHPGADVSTSAGQDLFNQWSGSIGHFENASPAAALFAAHPDIFAAFNAAAATNPALTPNAFIVDWANANPNDARLNDNAFLSSVGLELDPTPAVPAEQALLNYVLQKSQTDIAADAQRKIDADKLISSYTPAIDAAKQTVADIYQSVDATAYFRQNPDVAAAYQQAVASGSTQTPEQFVTEHYNNFGRFEGRANPSASNLLRQQTTASNQAAAQQLTALNTQLDTLRTNLSGELGAKAGALQEQLISLTQGLDLFNNDQKNNLAAQLATNFANLEAEIGARRTSLTTALSQMQGALGAEADARRAALSTELAALTAAQGPVNELREKGAQSLATAINLGVESTKDDITAKAAQDGYIGASSGTDMALARATVGARQQAAQALGQARLENAQDTASIARYGAREGRGISDNLAGGTRELATYGATEGRSLSDYAASGKRTLGDYGAAETRGIADTYSKGKLDLTSFGAGQQRELSDYGATQSRAIGDFGAGEKRGVADATASRNLGYFDQDIARRLASLSLPSAAVTNELNLRKTADDYANTGLTRTFNNLAFFNTSGVPTPTVTPATQRPVDSGMENLGAGLVNFAGNIGNANSWWAPRNTNTSAPSGAGTNTSSKTGATNPFRPIT